MTILKKRLAARMPVSPLAPEASCKRLFLAFSLGLGILLTQLPAHAQRDGEEPAPPTLRERRSRTSVRSDLAAVAPGELRPPPLLSMRGLGDVSPPQGASVTADETVRSRPKNEPGSQKKRSPTKLSRFYVKVRPFTFGLIGGALLEFGGDYVGPSGLWAGGELSPIAVNSLYRGIPSFSARSILGYATKNFGIAASVGTGLIFSQNFDSDQYYLRPISIGRFQLGPVLRFGPLTGTHARLRVAYSLIQPFFLPQGGDLEINIKVRERVRLQLNFAGDITTFGLYSSIGTQILFRGNGGPGTHILTTGLGLLVSLYPFYPAPMITVGYEKRW